MSAGERRAVFLDRDGTLIEDVGYPREPALVRLLPDAAEALRALRRQGFLLVVVSNQSGIGRGLVTPAEADAVAQRFLECLLSEGARVDASYYCPHAPSAGCACRKPSPGMLLQAAADLGIGLARSFLVGDKPSDIEAGRRAGCRTILLSHVPTGGGDPAPDCIASAWREAVAWITAEGAG